MPKRKCSGCGDRFDRELDGSINFGVLFFHKPECRIEYAVNNSKKLIEKGRKIRKTEQKKKDKVRLVELKTVGDYIKEAQTAVNKYVRLRDSNSSCISCGNTKAHKVGLTGHRYDAGHYRSRGAASHLRFNLLNIQKQCVFCNRNLSGNVVEYRKGLVKKIGLSRVELLEHDNKPRKFTVDYLKRVKFIFNKRAKFYEKRR